ncbi:MAG: hypothetical protein AABM67_11220 [Acidobacteriota bacterium]
MINKCASLVLVIALVFTVASTAARADTPKNTDTRGNVLLTLPMPATSARTETKPEEKLRGDLAKLVADTKAGKKKLSEPSQFKRARGNNLSKGQKIAIGVGIAAAVVVVILVVHARNHLFDDFKPFAP